MLDITDVVFVTACLVVTVGSQIQGKLLVSLFSTPLLTSWLFSAFLVLIDVLQWLFGGCKTEESKTRRSSPLYGVFLHMADITTFFIAANHASLWTIALTHLLVLNFWQLLNSPERTTTYIRASILLSIGIAMFLIEALQMGQIHSMLIEIGTAALHAYVNYYLHHYAQRYVESGQYLRTEIYASGSLVALLTPFAWLELRTIYLLEINVSYTAVTLVLVCALGFCYRRCGLFFNPLTQPNRAKFLIVSALLVVLITSTTKLTALMVIFFILVSSAAYLSSFGVSTTSQNNESKTNFSILAALCTILLLAQCTQVVVGNTIFVFSPDQTLISSNNNRVLQPIKLDPEYEMNRLVCLSKVRERVLREVGSRIIDGEPIAFMDFPMHWNLGDIFIWQGTQHVLEIHGQFPIVTDGFMDRNITLAKSLIHNGVVFLQGGGNFGDLWRDNMRFRLSVVQQIKDNDIVFMPQSIHYNKVIVAKGDNDTFQANHRVLLMFRDYASLDFSVSNFTGVPAMYVPDMALAMGPQTPSANPIVDIILLLRSDKEGIVPKKDRTAALTLLREVDVSFEVWDFPVQGFPTKIAYDNKTVVYDYTQIYPKQMTKLGPNNRHAFLGIRTQMANNLFSRGRVVITDRLHASIMSTLMGKPLVYLDNSYKKITNVRGDLAKEIKECSDTNLHARHTSTIVQAANLALKILDGSERI